jgi:predicted CopG family antitoxin
MNKSIKVVLRFSEKEKQDLDICVEASGKTMSEFIRGLISYKKEKMFPYYKIKKGKIVNAESEKPKLTQEQICVMQGGVVKEIGGKMFCDKTHFNKILKIQSGYTIPLEQVEEDE